MERHVADLSNELRQCRRRNAKLQKAVEFALIALHGYRRQELIDGTPEDYVTPAVEAIDKITSTMKTE